MASYGIESAKPSRYQQSGDYLWSNLANQNDLQRFRASGAGSGATYYDFQDWLKGEQSGQQQAQWQQNLANLMAQADPFASQRAKYQGQLSDLMTNPSAALESNPFFKASGEAGQEAAMRRLRAMGMGGSGNAALELQKQAQANLSGDFFRLSDLLGKFAGANSDPASAANVGVNLLSLQERQRQFDLGNSSRGGTTRSSGGGYPSAAGPIGVSDYWSGQNSASNRSGIPLDENRRYMW